MIKKFVFNPVQVNTYLIVNDKNEAIVIDPGCYFKHEQDEFSSYVDENNIKIVKILITHPHFDHLLGAGFMSKKYNVTPRINSNSKCLLENIEEYTRAYGFDDFTFCKVDYNLEEGDEVGIDGYNMEIMYMPGHADGSVCLYNKETKELFTGDVIFHSSIGRTDFPTGNMQLLLDNISNRIFTLPEDVIIYSGHGDRSSVKFEKRANPFFIN